MTTEWLGLPAPTPRFWRSFSTRRPYGWSPEEMHFQHPHLALSQIHSALAYYYENREKLDEQIERDYQEAKRLEPPLSDPALRQKLHALKNPK